MMTPSTVTRADPVTREDLIEFAKRDLERLTELGEKLRRQKPRDEQSLRKCRKLRADARAWLRRLTRPPKVHLHLHLHLHYHVHAGVCSPSDV